MPYITLEGNVGVGKSTLLHRLADELGWEAVEEGIEFDSGFQSLLKERYENPTADNVAKLQLYVANFMAERICSLDRDKYYVVERSVFATELFSLAANRPDIIDALAGHVLRVPAPELYLYLSAPPRLCLERIKKRDRKGEGEGISLEYLQKLHDIHERWFHMMAFFDRVQKVDAFDYPDVKKLAESIRAKMYRVF